MHSKSGKTAKQTCLTLLARRDHSKAELKNKLRVRKYQDSDAEEVLAELENQGLLSDSSFCENFINHRKNKGFGPEKISYELEKKGINKKIYAPILHGQDIDWAEILAKVYYKKYKQMLNFSHRSEIAKRINFLRSRGFSLELIQFFLKKIESEASYELV